MVLPAHKLNLKECLVEDSIVTEQFLPAMYLYLATLQVHYMH